MISIKKFIPGIAWFFLELFLLCLPGSEFPQHIDWLDKIYFDKWVHIGLFAILAYLFMMPYAKSNLDQKDKVNLFIKIALVVSVWGLTTEFIQKYFAYHRSFDLWDWAADSLGALLAYLFWKRRIKANTIN